MVEVCAILFMIILLFILLVNREATFGFKLHLYLSLNFFVTLILMRFIAYYKHLSVFSTDFY